MALEGSAASVELAVWVESAALVEQAVWAESVAPASRVVSGESVVQAELEVPIGPLSGSTIPSIVAERPMEIEGQLTGSVA